MPPLRHIWGGAALVIATTIGAGMFALPYAVSRIGWVPALGLLAGLACCVVYAHELYARVLIHFNEHRRLPGLARTELGNISFWPTFLVVFLGIIFSLVAYLLLAARFLHLLVPALPEDIALVLFWMAASLPLLARLRAFVRIEAMGTFVKAGLILVVALLAGRSAAAFGNLPAFGESSFAEAYGPILFALAGWTAVAPVTEYLKKRAGARQLRTALLLGTLASAALYICFVWGAASVGGPITEDAISGFASGNVAWLLPIVCLLGLFAVWTPYLTAALEIKDMIVDDLRRPAVIGLVVAIFFPPALILAGLTSYFFVVSLAGGFLLSIQYLLILLIGRRVLNLRGFARFALDGAMLVFLVAALYEGRHFF